MGVLACLVSELLASHSSPPELGLSSPRLAKVRKVRDGRDPPIGRHESYQREQEVVDALNKLDKLGPARLQNDLVD